MSPRQKLLDVYPHCLLLSELPLRTFGCVTYVHLQSQIRGKLDRRSIKCVFLGYSGSQKGYKCFCPNSRKMYTTLDVVFYENTSYFSFPEQSAAGSEQEQYWSIIDVSTTSNDLDTRTSGPTTRSAPDTPEDERLPNQGEQERGRLPITQVYSRKRGQVTSDIPPIAIRKGTRECLKYNKFLSNKRYSSIYPLGKVVSYDKLNYGFKAFTVNIDSQFIPSSITEALDHKGWKQAVDDEISALVKNDTWELVSKPDNVTPVGCKWVFTLKYNSDGTLNRYKARLVAKGFTQSFGIDYVETFAPVAKLNTIRIIFSLAINLDWKLVQLDIKNVFLNGELKEQVFMDIPPGYESKATAGKVCKLKKSIYGLKQSPRAWFSKFTRVLLSYGFRQAHSDHTLFVYVCEKTVVILIVYVDDIILTGNCHLGIEKAKKYLANEFEVKDLGCLRYFLGMEVGRTKTGMYISQRKYVLDLLQETGMTGCKPVSTPMETKGVNSS